MCFLKAPCLEALRGGPKGQAGEDGRLQPGPPLWGTGQRRNPFGGTAPPPPPPCCRLCKALQALGWVGGFTSIIWSSRGRARQGPWDPTGAACVCCCLGLTKASARQLQTPDLSAQFGFHEWGLGVGAQARMRGSDDSKATCNCSSPVKGLVAHVDIRAAHPPP